MWNATRAEQLLIKCRAQSNECIVGHGNATRYYEPYEKFHDSAENWCDGSRKASVECERDRKGTEELLQQTNQNEPNKLIGNIQELQ